MPGRGISGVAVAEIATGLVLAWSGIENVAINQTLKSLVTGKLPAPGPGTTPAAPGGPVGGSAAPGDTGAHGASASHNQAIGRLLGATYGWVGGQQWSDLVSLWNRESGWNNLALNSSSGAFGIAQALGHGAAGTGGKYGNQYPSKAANDGDATAQINWGLAYIAGRYGDPVKAWAHEESAGWY